MRKLTYLLIIAAITLSSCNYLRKKGILANKDYIERLENTIKDDSLEFEAKMEKLKLESQSKIDSIQKLCLSKNNGNYHVITGSFMNPLNAENFKKTMEEKGYKSEIIVASNGFNLVSSFNGNSLNDVLGGLNNLRSSVSQESWIYVK